MSWRALHGRTEKQTGAICNMSAQMVQHYGHEVSARALARDAMKLLEVVGMTFAPLLSTSKTTKVVTAIRNR